MMTESQGEWVKAQKTIIAMRPLKQPSAPKEPWRLSIFNLVTSNGFDLLIMSIIIINMFFMCITTWDPSPVDIDIYGTYKVMFVADIIFFVLYLVEMLLKWTGLGVRQYFKDPWNDFDFVLVVASIVDLIITQASSEQAPFPPALPRVMRLFRVVRILRILKTAKNLRTIITTIRISIPGLYNISILLFIFMVIYSVICMNLFFAVNYTPGESFNGIMHDLMSPKWGSNMLRYCPTCGPNID